LTNKTKDIGKTFVCPVSFVLSERLKDWSWQAWATADLKE